MITLLINLFAILIAISVHECSHAYVAYKLGDSTAKHRITLNPFVHIDPIGMLVMLVARIGWAKPVPINSSNFKRETRKRDLVLVSLAGAGGNILTAIICATFMKFASTVTAQVFLMTIIGYNLSFAAFNLLPIGGLDGWNIVKQFIPYKYYESVYKYESMSMYIFIIMILTNAHRIIMKPIYNLFCYIVQIFF